ncbi:LacI family DNA-binding transcriptional regulator [Microbacteriaceae bacterium VKM Ac-2855]|nr:LacI family DNA-binding transcriptional regulator [Microbacteriaceae bacterium VKM Ac-2855]
MNTDVRAARPTTSDIARVAGVSRSTVSHVLNNHRGKFSEETEARVLQALETLRYRPSMGGRALVNGRSDVLVVILPSVTIGYALQYALDQIVAQAAELGVSVVMRFAGSDLRSTVDALLYLRPLAVMDLGGLVTGERQELEREGLAFLPSSERLASEGSVNPEQVVGRIQVDALRATKAGIVFAAPHDGQGPAPAAATRQAAVEEACRTHGLPDVLTVAVPLTAGGATDALRDVLHPGIGVACYSDDIATAVLVAARRLGFAIPADVAVIGVDVTPLGQLLDPPLSSVRVDVAAAIDFNMEELRVLLGRPSAAPVGLTDVVSLHPGGTA